MQRTAKIPNKPRFSQVSQRAYEFSTELGITEFPVDPQKVIRQFPNWHLQGWLYLQTNTDEDDPLFLDRDGAEARTVIQRGDNNYLIVYDERIDNRHRIRWTLAHEIGHIVLGHLVHFDVTALNRRGLTKKQYGVLEVEAHWFAAELLSPKPVIKVFDFQERPQALGLICDISKESASKRLEQIKKPEYNYPTSAIRVLRNFYRHITQGGFYQVMHDNAIQFYNTNIYHELCRESRICQQCNGFITDDKYKHCPICGHAATSVYGYFPYKDFKGMISIGSPKEIYRQGEFIPELPSSNGRLEFCPLCKSVETVATGDNCDNCNIATQNYCLAERKTLAYAHRYCPDCGSEATFKAMYDLLPERLNADKIIIPTIYDDYIECEYWDFIVMSVRYWEKEMKLYATLEDSIAFYDCADMVLFVRGIYEADYARTAIGVIVGCLDKYAESPVKNIEVQIASLRPFACTCCGNMDISSIANFCIICGTSVSDKQNGNNGRMVDILNYTDGPQVDSENRFTQCPICKNSEFSEEANYCRICGRYRINLCEGYFEEDGYGNHSDEKTRHNNPANARFCEVCGRETEFLQTGILKPWESLQGDSTIIQASQPSMPQLKTVTASIDDDEDLPF